MSTTDVNKEPLFLEVFPLSKWVTGLFWWHHSYRGKDSSHPHSWLHSCSFPHSDDIQIYRLCTDHCGCPNMTCRRSNTFYTSSYPPSTRSDTWTNRSWKMYSVVLAKRGERRQWEREKKYRSKMFLPCVIFEL